MFRWRRPALYVALFVTIAFVLGLTVVWINSGSDRKVQVPASCSQSAIGDTQLDPASGPFFFDY